MIHKDDQSSESNKEIHRMKKFLALAIGLGLAIGTVSFAQDKTDDSKKTDDSGKKKKKKKKSADDKKMDAPSTDKKL
jgi:uncharacterized protein HemX